MRAAGAGICASFSPTGVGTPLAEGKEQHTTIGRDHVLEPIRGDYALIKAHRADRMGNLRATRRRRSASSTARRPATSGP
jgi:3-oxoadipate CoA-transferase alpha subunit